MIVPQNSAKALTALKLTVASSDFFARHKDLVGHALVISFGVIMFKVRIDSTSQRLLTEEDHPVQGLHPGHRLSGSFALPILEHPLLEKPSF